MDRSAGSMPTMTRRERRRQETIDEILDHSLAVMSEDGVAGLNLTAVAKRLGVQPPALYKYFPSLPAVYDALVRRAVDSFISAIATARDTAGPGVAAMRAIVRAVSEWSATNIELAQLLVWRPLADQTDPPEAFAPGGRISEILTDALAEAAATGEIDPAIVGRQGVNILSALVAGAVALNFAHFGSDWTSDDFIALSPDIVDVFVAGFAVRGHTAQA